MVCRFGVEKKEKWAENVLVHGLQKYNLHSRQYQQDMNRRIINAKRLQNVAFPYAESRLPNTPFL